MKSVGAWTNCIYIWTELVPWHSFVSRNIRDKPLFCLHTDNFRFGRSFMGVSKILPHNTIQHHQITLWGSFDLDFIKYIRHIAFFWFMPGFQELSVSRDRRFYVCQAINANMHKSFTVVRCASSRANFAMVVTLCILRVKSLSILKCLEGQRIQNKSFKFILRVINDNFWGVSVQIA